MASTTAPDATGQSTLTLSVAADERYEAAQDSVSGLVFAWPQARLDEILPDRWQPGLAR